MGDRWTRKLCQRIHVQVKDSDNRFLMATVHFQRRRRGSMDLFPNFLQLLASWDFLRGMKGMQRALSELAPPSFRSDASAFVPYPQAPA
jgi:hypothetical protein